MTFLVLFFRRCIIIQILKASIFITQLLILRPDTILFVSNVYHENLEFLLILQSGSGPVMRNFSEVSKVVNISVHLVLESYRLAQSVE